MSAFHIRHAHALAVTTIIMTLLGWSSVPLFLKHFSHAIDIWTSNGWRYGMSALMWLPVPLWGLWRRSLPAGVWKAALVPAAINIGAQTLFCWTFYKIDPGLATFGLRSNIVFATLGAAILFAPERVLIRHAGFLTGIIMVIVGTFGTMVLGQGLPKGATLDGIRMAVSSGAGFAGYALAVRKFMHGINAIVSFSIISLYTAAGMVGFMLLWGEGSGLGALSLLDDPAMLAGLPFPCGQFGVLAVSALIGIALGHVFYYYSISKLGVAASAGIVQLQPFFVAIASLCLFDERLSIGQWGSGAVAVAGAILTLVVQARIHRRNRRRDIVPDEGS